MRDYTDQALVRLGVNSFSIDNEGNIVSLNGDTIPPKEQILEEIEKIKQERALTLYAKKRRAEYPPIQDYIDGVVKGDQEQIQAYIDACLAVKAKYPKPEGV